MLLLRKSLFKMVYFAENIPVLNLSFILVLKYEKNKIFKTNTNILHYWNYYKFNK